jgi:hypothetical protein
MMIYPDKTDMDKSGQIHTVTWITVQIVGICHDNTPKSDMSVICLQSRL